jgi:menaquinone-dependent protoporphyrinogen oxidase
MRILVTYASRHGDTRGIAETIAAEIECFGHTTVFSDVSRVESLDGFDGVVLGSAVYLGHWLHSARAFVEKHQPELSRLPVWMFSSGALGGQEILEPAEVDGFTMTTNVIGHVVFGGRLNVRKLGIGERIVTKAVGTSRGDHRNWTEIRSWAQHVGHQAALLEHHHAVAPQGALPGTTHVATLVT